MAQTIGAALMTSSATGVASASGRGGGSSGSGGGSGAVSSTGEASGKGGGFIPGTSKVGMISSEEEGALSPWAAMGEGTRGGDQGDGWGRHGPGKANSDEELAAMMSA
jgi:hypothetical protein